MFNMKKYSARSMPAVRRDSDSSDWQSEFEERMKVSPYSSKAQQSLYDQISSIMGNKPKYPTVAAAVEDMKERSGMNAWKKADTEATVNSIKNAEGKIILFDKLPQIKTTTDNYITDTFGNLPIPAIVEKIKTIHKRDISDDGDWDDVNFLTYIKTKSDEEKSKHPRQDGIYHNLGKIPRDDNDSGQDNNDVFQALTPAVIASMFSKKKSG